MLHEFLSALKEGNQFLSAFPCSKLSELYAPETAALTEAFFKNLHSPMQGMKQLFSDSAWEQLSQHRQNYLRRWEINLRRSLTDSLHVSEGHVVLAAQGPLQDWALAEALIAALLTGHHVFLFVWAEDQRQAWEQWKSMLPDPRALHILLWQEELWSFVTRHPSISRIMLHVPGPLQETRLQLSCEAWQKTPILFQRWKSMSLVTKGFDAERDLPLIFSSIHEGGGLGFWNTTRLFVESTVEKAFLEAWQEMYPKWLASFDANRSTMRYAKCDKENEQEGSPAIFGVNPSVSPSLGDFKRVTTQDFLKTQGKRMAGCQPLLINTSACDEHHQLPAAEPLVTFHDLRYAFDINKWVTAAESYIWSLHVYGLAENILPSYLAQSSVPFIFKSQQPLAWAKVSWWHPVELKLGYRKWIS